MDGHPAKGVHPHAEAFDVFFGQELGEPVLIGGTKEDCIAVIAAQNHMIERAIDVQTRLARHPCRSGTDRESDCEREMCAGGSAFLGSMHRIPKYRNLAPGSAHGS